MKAGHLSVKYGDSFEKCLGKYRHEHAFAKIPCHIRGPRWKSGADSEERTINSDKTYQNLDVYCQHCHGRH